MKSVLKLTLCALFMLSIPAVCLADKDKGGKNSSDSEKKETPKERPRPDTTVEFIILNWGLGHKNMPRSVGYVEMDLFSSSTIVAECSNLGLAQFMIVTADDNRIVENMFVNTDLEPTVLIDFPKEDGKYIIKVTADGYSREWEFSVRTLLSQIREVYV